VRGLHVVIASAAAAGLFFGCFAPSYSVSNLSNGSGGAGGKSAEGGGGGNAPMSTSTSSSGGSGGGGGGMMSSDGYSLAWGTVYGGASDEHVHAIALDGANHLGLAGYFTHIIDLGTSTCRDMADHGGDSDALFARIDLDTQYCALMIEGTGGSNAEATNVSATLDGGFAFGGTFVLDLKPGTANKIMSTGANDVFVHFLDKSGQQIANAFQSYSQNASTVTLNGLTVAGDKLVAAGWYTGGIGGVAPTMGKLKSAGFLNIFGYGTVSKTGNAGDNHINGITANGKGMVTVGDFTDNCLDKGMMVSVAGVDLTEGFVQAADEHGVPDWTAAFGTKGHQSVTRVVRLMDGSYVVAGIFDTEVRDLKQGYVGSVATPPGTVATFFASLTSKGVITNIVKLSGTSQVLVADLALSPDGQIVAVGTFDKTVDLPTGTKSTFNGVASWIVDLNSGLNIQRWAVLIGDSSVTATSCTFGPNNGLYVAGDLAGSLKIGGTTLKSSGSTDIFLLKYAP
jgi:hypothetical protein